MTIQDGNGQQTAADLQGRALSHATARLSELLNRDVPLILGRGWYGTMAYDIELEVRSGELSQKVPTTYRRLNDTRNMAELAPSRAHVNMTLTKIAAIGRSTLRDLLMRCSSHEKATLCFEIASQDGCVQHVKTRYEAVHALNPAR